MYKETNIKNTRRYRKVMWPFGCFRNLGKGRRDPGKCGHSYDRPCHSASTPRRKLPKRLLIYTISPRVAEGFKNWAPSSPRAAPSAEAITLNLSLHSFLFSSLLKEKKVTYSDTIAVTRWRTWSSHLQSEEHTERNKSVWSIERNNCNSKWGNACVDGLFARSMTYSSQSTKHFSRLF